MNWATYLWALQRSTPDVHKIVADRLGWSPRHYTVRTRTGLRIGLRSGGGDRFVFSEVFAFGAYDRALAYLQPGMTVVDVGANIGLFSLAAADRMGGRGRIVAVEPIPGTIEQLSANVRLNNVEMIELFEGAVAQDSGELVIHEYPNPLFSSVYANVDGRTASGMRDVTVKALSLEDLFAERGIDTCDLLKLDCEGAEHLIIPAISRELAERVSALSVEFHKLDGKPCDHLIRHLTDLGYEHSFSHTHFFRRRNGAAP